MEVAVHRAVGVVTSLALMGLLAGVAPAAAQVLAELDRPAHVAAAGSTVAWSSWDADARLYRLTVRHDGRVVTPPVGPRGVPFDVDVARLPGGDTLLVYSRCASEGPTRLGVGLPLYILGRGCDLYATRLEGGGERRLGASTTAGSEALPTVAGGRLAFARRADGRSRVYVQPLGAPSRARPLKAPRRGRPLSLDLAGRKLALGWEGRESQARVLPLDGGRGRLAYSVGSGESIQQVVAPFLLRGGLWFGRFAGDGGGFNGIMRRDLGSWGLASRRSRRLVSLSRAGRRIAVVHTFDSGENPPGCSVGRQPPPTEPERCTVEVIANPFGRR